MSRPDTWKGLEWDAGKAIWSWGVAKRGAWDGPPEEQLPHTSGWEFP